MAKVFDSKYTPPKVSDRTIWQGFVNPSQKSSNPDTGRFANKYNPEKTGNTTRWRNQGYSGEDLYNKDQRIDSYERWRNKGKPVPKQEMEPHDQIGRVSSSWLTSLGWDTVTGEAVATFKDSTAEFYYMMSYELFLEWLHSPSKGRWLHDHPSIMSNYETRGGGGRKSFKSRIKSFDNSRDDRNIVSNTELAKRRADRYLARYR